ncbi:MAG: hypothetical protein Q9169_000139 [Polycauliona sp. 2 TL-2023]
MDVTGQDFHRLLPSLLEAIADAQFVAIDLEFSGISNQQKTRVRAPKQHVGGRASLQDRYEEEKSAAEKYQVLQMGITCVGESLDRGVYVVRPYNFNLNPFPDEKMNIQRDVTLQGRGSHGLEKPSKGKTMTIVFDRGTEPIAKVTPEFLNIAPISHSQPSYPDRGLNSFQRLLVHQYIRKEHPDLTTTTRQGFVQITPHNQEQRDAEKQYRNKTFEEKLARQVGLRWLIEAMQGGDLSAMNPDSFIPANESKKAALTAKIVSLRHRLKGHSTVLVGHNLFLDLIHLYACFFGALPDRIEDFQQTIHDLFPRIIDTKYLATHNNPGLAAFNLEELDRIFDGKVQPVVELHPGHTKYATPDAPSHEAGYDSLMTARLLIRSSVDLEASGKYIDELPSPPGDAFYTPPEGEGDDLMDFNDVSKQLEAIDKISSGSSSRPSSGVATDRTAFSHVTKFDLLGDLSDEIDPHTLQPRNPAPGMKPKPEMKRKIDNETGRRLPAWESDFWKVYGNKLQVNGTMEGVCDLGSWPR